MATKLIPSAPLTWRVVREGDYPDITVTAFTCLIDDSSSLVFLDSAGDPVTAFAKGHWLSVETLPNPLMTEPPNHDDEEGPF